MGFKNFRLQIAFRLLLILIAAFVFVVLIRTQFWLVSIIVLVVLTGLTLNLVRYVEYTNRQLANFLLALKQGDFSVSFSSQKESNTRLHKAYNEILDVFQKLRRDKEFNHHYLQNIVEQVQLALICFDEKHEVKLMNRAAKSLLGKPYLKNLNALKHVNEELFQAVKHLVPGQRNITKFVRKNELLQISIRMTEFKLISKIYRLYTFQDIGNELAQQETESWQKLIRVLNHEIMNSAIPISNLSAVVNQILVTDNGKPKDIQTLNEEEAEDLRGSVKTIEKRSTGLVKFINSYKSLTSMEQPKFEEIGIAELFPRIIKLLENKLSQNNIQVDVIMSPNNSSLVVDPDLIEQILINLLLNAIDAVEGKVNPKIILKAGEMNRRKIIQVIDNGKGISEEVMENVFVPFYTTKKEGSGIGLSLARQIMRLHKGDITVTSRPDEGAVFTLKF